MPGFCWTSAPLPPLHAESSVGGEREPAPPRCAQRPARSLTPAAGDSTVVRIAYCIVLTP